MKLTWKRDGSGRTETEKRKLRDYAREIRGVIVKAKVRGVLLGGSKNGI